MKFFHSRSLFAAIIFSCAISPAASPATPGADDSKQSTALPADTVIFTIPSANKIAPRLKVPQYNPQNETEDGNKSKWSKIKTKRDSPQNEAYLRVRFFNRPPYPIFAPKSTRLRRGQG